LNFKEILELIDKVAERGIAGVEIEQAGTKVKIEGKSAGPTVVHAYGDVRSQQPSVSGTTAEAPAAAAPPGSPALTAEQMQEEADAGLHIITSPIVGTFYRTPNPEADVFVNVGDSVSKGKVLCIIEAMKLMNEIESDVDGSIVRIYPQNGQPVEYGENLFAVRV
jgi:acetyl-CoA carboxylase biotin carboxyl carrier protein